MVIRYLTVSVPLHFCLQFIMVKEKLQFGKNKLWLNNHNYIASAIDLLQLIFQIINSLLIINDVMNNNFISHFFINACHDFLYFHF